MDAEPSTDRSTFSDPFAGAKTNLRDTAKWLATSLAALAAAALAGTSLTGISGIHGEALVFALLAGAFGIACILIAIGVMLQLLTSESLYLTDLEENFEKKTTAGALLKYLDRRSSDFLPPEIPNIRSFLEARRAAIDEIRHPTNSATRASAVNFIAAIERNSLPLLTSLVHFELLRIRFRQRVVPLLGLAVGAVIGIGTYAVLIGTAKENGIATVPGGAPLQLDAGNSWDNVSKSLTATCGNQSKVKAQVLSRSDGWSTIRLLSPENCAGYVLSVPSDLVISPASLTRAGK